MHKFETYELITYYLAVLVISLGLRFIDFALAKLWLGANLIFFGFILWAERPFIPGLRRSPSLAILVSTLVIFVGLLVSRW